MTINEAFKILGHEVVSNKAFPGLSSKGLTYSHQELETIVNALKVAGKESINILLLAIAIEAMIESGEIESECTLCTILTILEPAIKDQVRNYLNYIDELEKNNCELCGNREMISIADGNTICEKCKYGSTEID